jgi:hypothetical protein
MAELPAPLAQPSGEGGRGPRRKEAPVLPLGETVCGTATSEEITQNIRIVVAIGILRLAEYISSSPARTCNSPQSVFEGRLPAATSRVQFKIGRSTIRDYEERRTSAHITASNLSRRIMERK